MKVVTFGRNDSNDVIINDQFVGRNHCQIIENDGKFFVVDLNSTNGTFVNGVRVSGQHPISLSDEIRIGKTTLNWQSYFKQPSNIPQPIVEPIKSPDSTRPQNKKWALIAACIVAILVIGGLTAFLLLRPYTKHATALPQNMLALSSINIHTLQKQTEVSQADLRKLVSTIEREAFDNRVNIMNSGIKYVAPIYAFIEDLDINTERASVGIVLPLSEPQQFSNFILNLMNDPQIILNTYNDIQYIVYDGVFIGFDQKKCLCYTSFTNDNYQLENKGLALLSQDASKSGKNSKLFSLLKNKPLSCAISGNETDRVLNRTRDIREVWSELGINLRDSYLALQMEAKKDGVVLSLNSIDNKAIEEHNIFRNIKGTKLADFSTGDIAFAAINVNGNNLLREILTKLPADTRNEVYRFFDKCNRESFDIESIIRAIDGDVCLSICDWSAKRAYARTDSEPAFLLKAEIPSARELDNSARSIQNLIVNAPDLSNMVERVERDNGFLFVYSQNAYQSQPHSSLQQYKKDICDNYIYISVNVNPLVNEYERDLEREVKDLMPYLKSLKRVSASVSGSKLSLQLELTRTWKYLLNNY